MHRQQPGASVTAEERARQLLSGDVTAGDFVDLEDSMMDDSFIEESIVFQNVPTP